MINQDRANPLLVAAMAGLAGAVVALLFAPQSGRETRRKIRESAEDAGENTRQKARQGVEKVRSAKDSIGEAVKSTAQKAKEEADQVIANAKEE